MVTVDRVTIANYLHGQLSRLAAEIGQVGSGADAAGYGPDIDLALRRVGVARADLPDATVSADLEDDVFALARYYALRRFASQLATKVDIDNGFGMQGGRREVFKSVKELLEMAQAEIAALGYSVGGDGAGGLGLVNLELDFIEPEPTGLGDMSIV